MILDTVILPSTSNIKMANNILYNKGAFYKIIILSNCLSVPSLVAEDLTMLTKISLSPQYKQNPDMFKQTARLWSHVYAGAPVSSPDYTRKIDKLCAMGFDKVRTTFCLQY